MTRLIVDTKTLESRLKPLFKESFVTVDTEFLREKTYYPLCCLIQVGGANDEFAIDPLADGIDLKLFFKLMGDRKVVKVLHSCTQDMEIMLNMSGEMPRNVFDTQIAAQVLGFGESASYGTLVDELVGKVLDKSSRHTDWSARPLTDKQLDYAISDVTYLRTVYTKLVDMLDEQGRRKWYDEEMKPYAKRDMYEVEPKEAWRKIKVRSTKKDYLSRLQALAAWREERAQRIDKPRSWVMKNDAILEIASINPKSPDDLDGLRFFNFSRHPDLARDIVSLIKKSRLSLPPKVTKTKPLPKGSAALMDLLKVLLHAQCERHQVAPSVVAKMDELREIARAGGKKASVPAMKGWRFEVFGQYAIKLAKGELALTAHKNQIELIEPEFTD